METKLPYEMLGIPLYSKPDLGINKRLYGSALAELDRHEQPIIPAWSLWDKSCRIAQWEFFLGNWDSCIEWAGKAADASQKCLQINIDRPLPEDFSRKNDYAFAPFGLMVEDRDKLRNRKWLHFFETGVCWALIGGHFSIAESIADLDLAALPYQRSEAGPRQFSLGIQNHLLGLDCQQFLNDVISNEHADPHLNRLSQGFLGALSNNQSDYSVAIENALRIHIRKHELQTLGHEVPVFPLFAIIVWHLAEKMGFYPNLPPFLQNHLFVINKSAGSVLAERAERINESLREPLTPADRLGIVDYEYEEQIRFFKSIETKFNNGERLIDMSSLMTSTSKDIAQNSYLRGEIGVCKEWCKIHCDAVINELLGDWHFNVRLDIGQIDPMVFRYRVGFWRSTLSEGLAWAAVGNYWAGVERLLAFPDPRMAPPDGGEAFRLYYLGLSRWWKNENDLEWTVETKTRKGANLLVDQIQAITDQNDMEFAKAMNKYMSGFLKKIRGDYEFPFEAIFNWNLAKRKGMTPKVKPRNIDYLFELPE